LDGAEIGAVDVVAQTRQILQGGVPVEGKDLGGELAPQHIQVVLYGLEGEKWVNETTP